MLAATEYDLDTPWNRQPCDSDSRWAAFQRFRDMTPPRSLAALGRALTLKSAGRLEAWAKSDGWRERCAEFDRYVDGRRVAVIVDALAEDAATVANEHIGALRMLREVAVAVVADHHRRLALGEIPEMSFADVRGILKDTITLERLIRGEATERVDHTIGGFDLSKLTTAEVEELRALEEKAGADDPV